MKKITFILFALIAGTTFAQDSKSATANAAADIVSPIGISAQQDLNFGKVANNTAGTVVISNEGVVTGLSQIGGSAPKAAAFDITAANGFAYTITLPGSDIELTHSNGTGTNDIMIVNNFNHNATTTTGSGSAQEIGVGATLNVDASQATGNYTGTFDVTVSYN